MYLHYLFNLFDLLPNALMKSIADVYQHHSPWEALTTAQVDIQGATKLILHPMSLVTLGNVQK